MLISLDVSTLAYPDSKFINLRLSNNNIVYGYFISIKDNSIWSIKSGTLKPLKLQKGRKGSITRDIQPGYNISINGARRFFITVTEIRKIVATTAKKPEPVLLDESTKQQAAAWEAIFATLQKNVPGWNDRAGTSRDNACKTIKQLSNDSKTLSKYQQALGSEGCVAIRHLSMVDAKDDICYIPTKIPETFTKKSSTFLYAIEKCTTPEKVQTEITRVVDKFKMGLDQNESVEVVNIDLNKNLIHLRKIKTFDKRHTMKYAEIKLQQIINDFAGVTQ